MPQPPLRHLTDEWLRTYLDAFDADGDTVRLSVREDLRDELGDEARNELAALGLCGQAAEGPDFERCRERVERSPDFEFSGDEVRRGLARLNLRDPSAKGAG